MKMFRVKAVHNQTKLSRNKTTVVISFQKFNNLLPIQLSR